MLIPRNVNTGSKDLLLGEPGHTALYVGLPSTWGSVDGDQMFSPFFVVGLLTGDSDRYKWMNKPLAVEMKLLSP